MRLGIFGGTFNPIHLGHLKVADFFYNKLNLDIVFFIPAGNPPHKSVFCDYQHRFKMVEMALKNFENFKILDIEKPNNGKSYTINTLKKIRKSYPNDELLFLIGEDNVPEIQSWFNYEKLFDSAQFVVLSRKTASKESFKNLPYFDKLKFLDMPKIDISSNMIRRNISQNIAVNKFLDENVKNYIKKNKLYSKGE